MLYKKKQLQFIFYKKMFVYLFATLLLFYYSKSILNASSSSISPDAVKSEIISKNDSLLNFEEKLKINKSISPLDIFCSFLQFKNDLNAEKLNKIKLVFPKNISKISVLSDKKYSESNNSQKCPANYLNTHLERGILYRLNASDSNLITRWMMDLRDKARRAELKDLDILKLNSNLYYSQDKIYIVLAYKNELKKYQLFEKFLKNISLEKNWLKINLSAFKKIIEGTRISFKDPSSNFSNNWDNENLRYLFNLFLKKSIKNDSKEYDLNSNSKNNTFHKILNLKKNYFLSSYNKMPKVLVKDFSYIDSSIVDILIIKDPKDPSKNFLLIERFIPFYYNLKKNYNLSTPFIYSLKKDFDKFLNIGEPILKDLGINASESFFSFLNKNSNKINAFDKLKVYIPLLKNFYTKLETSSQEDLNKAKILVFKIVFSLFLNDSHINIQEKTLFNTLSWALGFADGNKSFLNFDFQNKNKFPITNLSRLDRNFNNIKSFTSALKNLNFFFDQKKDPLREKFQTIFPLFNSLNDEKAWSILNKSVKNKDLMERLYQIVPDSQFKKDFLKKNQEKLNSLDSLYFLLEILDNETFLRILSKDLKNVEEYFFKVVVLKDKLFPLSEYDKAAQDKYIDFIISHMDITKSFFLSFISNVNLNREMSAVLLKKIKDLWIFIKNQKRPLDKDIFNSIFNDQEVNLYSFEILEVLKQQNISFIKELFSEEAIAFLREEKSEFPENFYKKNDFQLMLKDRKRTLFHKESKVKRDGLGLLKNSLTTMVGWTLGVDSSVKNPQAYDLSDEFINSDEFIKLYNENGFQIEKWVNFSFDNPDFKASDIFSDFFIEVIKDSDKVKKIYAWFDQYKLYSDEEAAKRFVFDNESLRNFLFVHDGNAIDFLNSFLVYKMNTNLELISDFLNLFKNIPIETFLKNINSLSSNAEYSTLYKKFILIDTNRPLFRSTRFDDLILEIDKIKDILDDPIHYDNFLFFLNKESQEDPLYVFLNKFAKYEEKEALKKTLLLLKKKPEFKIFYNEKDSLEVLPILEIDKKIEELVEKYPFIKKEAIFEDNSYRKVLRDNFFEQIQDLENRLNGLDSLEEQRKSYIAWFYSFTTSYFEYQSNYVNY